MGVLGSRSELAEGVHAWGVGGHGQGQRVPTYRLRRPRDDVGAAQPSALKLGAASDSVATPREPGLVGTAPGTFAADGPANPPLE